MDDQYSSLWGTAANQAHITCILIMKKHFSYSTLLLQVLLDQERILAMMVDLCAESKQNEIKVWNVQQRTMESP